MYGLEKAFIIFTITDNFALYHQSYKLQMFKIKSHGHKSHCYFIMANLILFEVGRYPMA